MEGLTSDQLDLMRRERLALSKLTDKQKLFCEEYVRSFNKLAALKAGGYYTPKKQGGKQDKLIQSNFERIMAAAVVGEYITLLKQSVASRLGVSMDDIIDQYKTMAFANIDDYVTWTKDGFTELKSSSDLTKAQKAGILEIVETTTKMGKTVKIKLYNKQTALDRLFEILKDLESSEDKSDGPVRFTQTQINIILQDPVKRRAIEHLAGSGYDKQISLVGTDKDQIEFNKHMDKITNKLLEATSGVNGQRSIECARVEAPEEIGGKEGNRADHEGADQYPVAERKRQSPRQGDGTGPDPVEIVEDGSRYGVDGL